MDAWWCQSEAFSAERAWVVEGAYFVVLHHMISPFLLSTCSSLMCRLWGSFKFMYDHIYDNSFLSHLTTFLLPCMLCLRMLTQGAMYGNVSPHSLHGWVFMMLLHMTFHTVIKLSLWCGIPHRDGFFQVYGKPVFCMMSGWRQDTAVQYKWSLEPRVASWSFRWVSVLF